MADSVLKEIRTLASSSQALEETVQYLAARLHFLRKNERVLICFSGQGMESIGSLMEQAVLRRGAVPVMWGEDQRWKALLRLAFSSRASTIIGMPLVVLGLSKLAKANGTPLFIRNVVTAGYPCPDWIIDGIIKGLDCDTWGCFEPGNCAVVAGFSCGSSRGIHLRSDLYGVDIVHASGEPVPEGEIGEMVLYPLEDPTLRYFTGDHGRLERTPCPCGCQSPRLMDITIGRHRSKDQELANMAEYLHKWTSILDCRLEKGHYGLEMELVIFPGEKLPKLPSCAKRVIRPWDPDRDIPFGLLPILENPVFIEESH